LVSTDIEKIPEAAFREWPHVCMILKDEALDIGKY